MGKTGLRLELVLAGCMEAAGRQLPEHHTDMLTAQYRPSTTRPSDGVTGPKTIGLVEVCRPMDEFSDQLIAVESYICTASGPSSGCTAVIRGRRLAD